MEFEERADQLSNEEINRRLADGEHLTVARQKLLASGAKFLIGPRGTGKTHLMRYTYTQALLDKSAPLVLYASFNKYLHLEPLLKKTPDALKRFHSWVLAKLLLSVFDFLNDLSSDTHFLSEVSDLYDEDKLRQLVSLLERGSGDELYEEFGQSITVDAVIRAVKIIGVKFGRSRAVLLLDDAALSLSDQYLIAFFEIFRVLKVEGIAPKASVYPGLLSMALLFMRRMKWKKSRYGYQLKIVITRRSWEISPEGTLHRIRRKIFRLMSWNCSSIVLLEFRVFFFVFSENFLLKRQVILSLRLIRLLSVKLN